MWTPDAVAGLFDHLCETAAGWVLAWIMLQLALAYFFGGDE